MSEAKSVVLIGATSAMARAIAEDYAKTGWSLLLAARDKEENERNAQDIRMRYGTEAHAVALDVANFDSHEAVVQDCIARGGDSLAGVIMVSGFMDDQSKAQTDWDIARRTMDVNFTGAVSILNRFANHFEERKSGFLAVVGSVAGDRGRQSNYIYGAAKGGLALYLEGLRNRLYPAGVHVTTIKPGFVDTKMTWGQVPFALAPEDAAKAIRKAIDAKKNVAYIPWFWRYIMAIIRHIPEWQFKRMKM